MSDVQAAYDSTRAGFSWDAARCKTRPPPRGVGGLVAPALRAADTKSLGQLMSEFRDLVERSRRGQLRSSEYTDATITVTSMGERGVETVFGVVNPPQVAIVGFGKIVERPWVRSGEIRVTPVVTVSLSADHQVSDGHQGAMFLNRIERLVQEPDAP